MKIKDLLQKSCILIDPPAADKKGIITQLAAHLASINNLPDGRLIAQKILEREAEVSTGIGYGIAIPHARMEKIDRIYMAAARSVKGIDYASIDGLPVYLIFMLISPAGASNEHVQVLSSLSRIMSYEDIRKKLIAAKKAEQFLDLLVKGEIKYAG
ncbi:MAG: PTS sugar transporter subunit IIA [Chitinispirillaceae bacterium]|nr:PTS sugar transporter subunit IIA [Chitinispirillaceae bacterium]